MSTRGRRTRQFISIGIRTRDEYGLSKVLFFREKVEIADKKQLGSKSGGGNSVWVQLPPPAPNKSRTYDVSCFSSIGEFVPTVMVL
jgi:hypothetical protein